MRPAATSNYKLDRWDPSAGTWDQIYYASATQYTDSGSQLQPGTTYYYEVCASNSSGDSAFSSEASATTLVAVPAIPTGLTATATGSQSIVISWSASSGASNYKLDRWDPSAGTWDQIYYASATQYTDSGSQLQPGTTYDYEVCASNSSGDSAFSSEASATTLVAVPATPTGLTATATGSQSIVISWSASSGASNYKLDRWDPWAGTWDQIYYASATQYTDSGSQLQPGTTYYYEVCASNSSGDSAFSSEASAMTLVAVPATPTGLTATATGSQSIVISWNSSSGASNYKLDRWDPSTSTWKQIYYSSATSYTDSGSQLQPNTTYYYEVCASNSSGDSAFSSSVSATTLAGVPNPPTGLTVSASALQTLSVSWNAVSGATNYVLDRSTSSGGPFAQVYSGTTAAYADSGLQFGTTYYYEVNATTGGGTSTFSSVVSGTTLPGVPTGLSATATSSQAISVSWTAVAGAATYTLQRATSASGPWTQIYTGATAAFGDSGLQAGTTYYYEVRTNTATGNSAYSSSVSATTLAAVPNPPTGLTVSASALQTLSVSWNAVSGATNYVLDRSTSSGGPFAQVYSGTTAAYADSGLQFGTTYYYEVNATTGGGTSTFSSVVSGTTLPGIPTGLSATATSSQAISVSWTAVAGAATYTLQRATSASGPWTQIYTGATSRIRGQRFASRDDLLLRGPHQHRHRQFGLFVVRFRHHPRCCAQPADGPDRVGIGVTDAFRQLECGERRDQLRA